MVHGVEAWALDWDSTAFFFFFFFKFVHYLYSSNRLPDGVKFTVAMLTMQTDPAVQTR